MAAISALAAYGSDSSDSESETVANPEDFHLHLKPLENEKAISTIPKPGIVSAAPEVAVKVGSPDINRTGMLH